MKQPLCTLLTFQSFQRQRPITGTATLASHAARRPLYLFASFALAVSPLASQKKKARAAEDAAAAAADAIAASKARLDKILADGNAQVDKAKADGDSDMADVRLDASIYDTIFIFFEKKH